jgi:phosphoserine phosphatase
MSTPSFGTVVLDVDSTISGVEGIDWLAKRKGAVIGRDVATLTDRAMRGEIPLEQVYGLRLAAIRPRRDEVDELSREYVRLMAPNCRETITAMQRAGVRVILMSGGLRHAIVRLALELAVDAEDLKAVNIYFDAGGAYSGFESTSVLTTSTGKGTLLATLKLARPILAVGDGATDLAMRGTANTFAAFTGFVTREAVVAAADVVVGSFSRLRELVLPTEDKK